MGARLLVAVVAAVAVTTGVAVLVLDRLRDGDDGPGATVRLRDGAIGHRVTVAGRVGEVVSAKSFTVTDGTNAVLVLDVSVVPAIDNDRDGVLVGEQVRVTGVARRFVVNEIERYVGEFIDERYDRFVGKPVVVADAVTPVVHERAGGGSVMTGTV